MVRDSLRSSFKPFAENSELRRFSPLLIIPRQMGKWKDSIGQLSIPFGDISLADRATGMSTPLPTHSAITAEFIPRWGLRRSSWCFRGYIRR
jgi:hypothetical protein